MVDVARLCWRLSDLTDLTKRPSDRHLADAFGLDEGLLWEDPDYLGLENSII
jgi:hypothetical protein